MSVAHDPPWGLILPATDFRWDMNSDGLFTVSDVWLWLTLGADWAEWLFFLPGNSLIWALLKYQASLATFLEINTEFYNSWITGIVSAIVWLIIFGVWGACAVVFPEALDHWKAQRWQKYVRNFRRRRGLDTDD